MFPCQSPSAGVTDPSASSGCDSGPASNWSENWSEVKAKVDAQVGTWLRRCFSLNGIVEVCAVYIFPLIFYRLSILPLVKAHRLALQRSLSRLLRGGRRPMVHRQVCCQHPSNEGLGTLI